MATPTGYEIVVTLVGTPGQDVIDLWLPPGRPAQWFYATVGADFPHPVPRVPGVGPVQPLGQNTGLYDTNGFQAMLQGFVLGQVQVGAKGLLVSAAGGVYNWRLAFAGASQVVGYWPPPPKEPPA